MRLVGVTAGADLCLTPPSWRWGVSAWAGGGFTIWAADHFAVADSWVSFQHTYPVSAGGLSLDYALSPSLSAYLGSRGDRVFVKREEMRALALLMRHDEPIERVSSVSLVLGIRWRQ